MASCLLEEDRLQQLLLAAVQAGGARRGGWAAPLLLLALCAALGAAAYLTWRHRQEERRRLEAAAAVADGEHIARFCNVLPAWALNPDASSCLWVNNLLAQVWPHLERFGCRFLQSSDFLESQINATTFWRPPMLRSSYIKVQGVALGQEPPRVTGIKAFPKQGGLHDELLIEQSFVWDSKMEVKLLVTLLGKAQQVAKAQGGSGGGSAWAGLHSLLSRASRVRVGVSNLAVRGTLRLSLKPLLDDFPFAGSAKVSLVGTPEFSYQLNVLGGDPYLVPGVKMWVDSFMRETVLLPFTFPDGFVYDLTTHSVVPVEKPEGLLEVAVVEARNVPRMDFFGKSDPYVRLWVRESQKLQTATRSRTLSPVWNETFTFLVHSSQHQQLSMALYDSDMWPNTDDLIGRLSLPISSLNLSPGAVNDLWLPVPRNGKRGKGPEERQRVAAARVASGGLAGPAGDGGSNNSRRAAAGVHRRSRSMLRRRSSPGGPAAVSRSEDTAGVLSQGAGRHAPPSPFASAAAGPAFEPGGQPPAQQQQQQLQAAASPEPQPSSMSSGLLAQTTEAWQQLRLLALNPLDALRSRECMVHVVATFYPLSEQEIAAVEMEAGRQQRGEERAAGSPSRTASLLADSPVHNMLRGGVLYVYLDRADNLSSSKGFTRNMRVDVSVGTLYKSTERGKVPFRHRSNPVFEETVELVVPGAVAQQRGAEVEVEVWVEHYLRKASFKGRMSLPLQRVIQHKRVRDTWHLRDSPSGRPGTLTAEFRWLSTMAAAADVHPF
ncbi:hypothetical protein ABPG75_013003 [Micractinium tetrahymenae]